MYSTSQWAKPKGLFLECSVGYLELRRLKLKYTWQFTLCLLQIIDSRLPTGSTNQVSITMVVEVASGKGHTLTTLNCQKFTQDSFKAYCLCTRIMYVKSLHYKYICPTGGLLERKKLQPSTKSRTSPSPHVTTPCCK